jgi:hypothetical protein
MDRTAQGKASMTNQNLVSRDDARNFDEDELFTFAFEVYPILTVYILPVYKLTEEFRYSNNITATWRKKCVTIEEAISSLTDIEYDILKIIE